MVGDQAECLLSISTISIVPSSFSPRYSVVGNLSVIKPGSRKRDALLHILLVFVGNLFSSGLALSKVPDRAGAATPVLSYTSGPFDFVS